MFLSRFTVATCKLGMMERALRRLFLRSRTASFELELQESASRSTFARRNLEVFQPSCGIALARSFVCKLQFFSQSHGIALACYICVLKKLPRANCALIWARGVDKRSGCEKRIAETHSGGFVLVSSGAPPPGRARHRLAPAGPGAPAWVRADKKASCRCRSTSRRCARIQAKTVAMWLSLHASNSISFQICCSSDQSSGAFWRAQAKYFSFSGTQATMSSGSSLSRLRKGTSAGRSKGLGAG